MKKFICFIAYMFLLLNLSFNLIAQRNNNDLIITELMVDPSPSLYLPSEEFVELYNRSDSLINLSEYFFQDEKTIVSLKGTIEAKSYVILCHEDDQELFKNYGKVISLEKWPSLNNDQDKLSLTLKQEVVFELAYVIEDIFAPLDQEGGYSLELINIQDSVIDFASDYQYSVHTDGGTPGKENSLASLSDLENTYDLVCEKHLIQDGQLNFSFSSMEQSKLFLKLYDQNGAFIGDILFGERVLGMKNWKINLLEEFTLSENIYILNFQALNERGDYFHKNEAFYLINNGL